MEQSNAHILMKNNGKIKILFLVVIILLIIYTFTDQKFVKGKVLVINNQENNTEYFLSIPDSKFTMNYIHSVHLTPVYELFEITKENTINLKETRFYSLGVGMPFGDEGGTFQSNNGEFILKFSRKFDNLYLRVSSIPQHAIEIGGKQYPLLKFAKNDERIKIYAKDKWIFVRK